MNIKKITLLALLVVVVALQAYAFSKQSASAPGEVLNSDGDVTTATQLSGVFAVEMTSTGVGTVLIQRSENNSTWVTVKTITNTSAGDQRKYIYESFGDGTLKFDKAWYRAYMSGAPTSGSFRVRLVQ